MTSKRETLRLRGDFMGTAADEAAASAYVPSTNLPVAYIDPLGLIEDGLNPFMVWRRDRRLGPGFVAARMGVPDHVYNAFEGGHYLGLASEHILKFCAALSISPEKMATPSQPMPAALIQVLLSQAVRGSTPRIRAAGLKALEAHCVEAETDLMHQGREIAHLPHSDLVTVYLSRLAVSNVHGECGLETPEEILNTLLEEKDEEAAHLQRQSEHPKPDIEMRNFNDCVLRLYGSGMTAKVWAALRDSRAAMKYRAHKTKTMSPEFTWEAFCETIRNEPELLGEVKWGYTPAHVIGDRTLRQDGAVALMLSAFETRMQRWETRLGPLKAKADTMEKQIACLREWSHTEAAARLMTMWGARQEIRETLNGQASVTWTGFQQKRLPRPRA